ncbi:MAG: thioredoxin family protein, partial [Rhodospirillaceae bacterium]|nr:thioredoxin family protein [Rhodospirillaceae bacterium]
GRPVFINFTAAWCITCIANEQVVLRLESVRKAVDSARMATLKGDWTRRDPVITEHLARFGRSGVPLYVIYPPEGSPKQPLVLPQILTEGGTVAAIRSMAAETRRAEGPRDRAAPPEPR